MNERDFNELRTEVDSLRRRLDEQGDTLRRTERHVRSLSDSIGQLVAGQRKRERAISLNSFIAYLVFTVLLGGGFFALYRARSADLVSDRNAAAAERDQARTQAQTTAAELAARDQAAAKAHELYATLRDGEPAEAITGFAALDLESLTPTERDVFTEAVARARAGIVDAGYLAGLDAYQAGDDARAIDELSRALAYASDRERVPTMRYYLGRAHLRAEQNDQAVRQLELALAGSVEDTLPDARYHFAEALMAAGDAERARLEFDQFVAANPSSPLAWQARRTAAQLTRAGATTH